MEKTLKSVNYIFPIGVLMAFLPPHFLFEVQLLINIPKTKREERAKAIFFILLKFLKSKDKELI